MRLRILPRIKYAKQFLGLLYVRCFYYNLHTSGPAKFWRINDFNLSSVVLNTRPNANSSGKISRREREGEKEKKSHLSNHSSTRSDSDHFRTPWNDSFRFSPRIWFLQQKKEKINLRRLDSKKRKKRKRKKKLVCSNPPFFCRSRSNFATHYTTAVQSTFGICQIISRNGFFWGYNDWGTYLIKIKILTKNDHKNRKTEIWRWRVRK